MSTTLQPPPLSRGFPILLTSLYNPSLETAATNRANSIASVKTQQTHSQPAQIKPSILKHHHHSQQQNGQMQGQAKNGRDRNENYNQVQQNTSNGSSSSKTSAGQSKGTNSNSNPAQMVKVNIVPKRSPSFALPFPTSIQLQLANGTSSPPPPSVVLPEILNPSINTTESESDAKPIPKEIRELEHLLLREGQLLEQLKLQFKNGHPASLSPQISENTELTNELPMLTSEQQSRKVAQELKAVMESKRAGRFFKYINTWIDFRSGRDFLTNWCCNYYYYYYLYPQFFLPWCRLFSRPSKSHYKTIVGQPFSASLIEWQENISLTAFLKLKKKGRRNNWLEY